MKKTINMPEVRVINFESHDVIATSGEPNKVVGVFYQEDATLTEERRSIWE